MAWHDTLTCKHRDVERGIVRDDNRLIVLEQIPQRAVLGRIGEEWLVRDHLLGDVVYRHGFYGNRHRWLVERIHEWLVYIALFHPELTQAVLVAIPRRLRIKKEYLHMLMLPYLKYSKRALTPERFFSHSIESCVVSSNVIAGIRIDASHPSESP